MNEPAYQSRTGPPIVAARCIFQTRRKEQKMKLSDVVVGGRYTAKFSGALWSA